MKKFNLNAAVAVLISAFVLSLTGATGALAAGPASVNLLSADNFTILSKTGITNTGSHTSAITGNIGSSPITASAMSNVFCSEITGSIYGVDAAYVGSGNQACFASNPPLANKTTVDNAVLDMGTAYTDAAGRTNPTATELGAGNIGGLTLAPGLYKWSTDVTIPTNVTLSGSANDVWIFQIAGNLTVASGGSVAAGTKVILAGGAKSSNVFWQVGGLTGATLGTYSTFNGNILSAKQVIMQTGAVLNGRALSQTQVTLDAATVTSSASTSTVTPVVGTISPTSATLNTATTFSASYSDSDTLASCSLYADGQLAGIMVLTGSATSGTASRSHTFSSAGSHTLQARCVDVVGNTGVGSVTTVSVSSSTYPDSTSPSAPTNLARLSTGSTNTATINWSASSDNVGVTSYQVSIDGKAYTNVGSTLTFTTSALDQGTHSIAVRAQDSAGNVSAATSLSVAISISSPIIPTSFTLEEMLSDATLIMANGGRTALEASTGRFCELASATAVTRVSAALGNVSNATARAQIENFMACGTRSSLHLGAGERLGVVNSYRSAFGRLPTTQAQWNDVLKIANGRFPGEMSAAAEARAKTSFRAVYLRDANMNVTGDNNAVVVMAYGLRPLPRNLVSEAPAIITFRAVYARMPSSASDWDIVRAIAYSGATR